MRLSFWRDWMDKIPFRAKAEAEAEAAPLPAAAPVAAAPVVPSVPAPASPAANPELGDIDLRAIWDVLVRKRMWVIVPTALAFVLSLLAVNMITPRYKSEARILIDGRENVFLRPNGDQPGAVAAVARSCPRSHQGQQAR